NLPFSLRSGERALSILAVWHSYERVFEMVTTSMGVCTYHTSIRTLAGGLKSVEPHVMASAPRLWESLYQKLMARVETLPPPRRRLFHMARAAGCAVRNAERFFRGQELDVTGRNLAENLARAAFHASRWLLYRVPLAVLEPLVLAKLRKAVGCGCFRGTISGGGALQPHVDEFFNSIGIPVLEGYGLTESCPVLAVRTWNNLVIGTVGPPFPETEIRIVDLTTGEVLFPDRSRRDGGRGRRGEILARGPQIMRGYYKDAEGTAKVLRDGWLSTGDIGMITFNNCLKILGRCKDTIVLLNGENVEPVPIENRLTSSPLIESCMVTGQDQKHLGVLIVPSIEGFRAAGISAANLAELAARPEAAHLLEKEIRSLISPEAGFKPFERIAAFRMLPRPFEPGRELTATLKLRRHVISETYSSLLLEMHGQEGQKAG
ncbi:MAG: AMP-binding protein, partial [Terrimicrobiaceae bacterium]|nr:AMP-binding protein [Terrimicrobiaceae bacterium]